MVKRILVLTVFFSFVGLSACREDKKNRPKRSLSEKFQEQNKNPSSDSSNRGTSSRCPLTSWRCESRPTCGLDSTGNRVCTIPDESESQIENQNENQSGSENKRNPPSCEVSENGFIVKVTATGPNELVAKIVRQSDDSVKYIPATRLYDDSYPIFSGTGSQSGEWLMVSTQDDGTVIDFSALDASNQHLTTSCKLN